MAIAELKMLPHVIDSPEANLYPHKPFVQMKESASIQIQKKLSKIELVGMYGK